MYIQVTTGQAGGENVSKMKNVLVLFKNVHSKVYRQNRSPERGHGEEKREK